MHTNSKLRALALLSLAISSASFAGEFCEEQGVAPVVTGPPQAGHECYQRYSVRPRGRELSTDVIKKDLPLDVSAAPLTSVDKRTIALQLCGLDELMPIAGQSSAHVTFAELGFGTKFVKPDGSDGLKGHILQLSAWNAPSSVNGAGAHYLLVEWQLADRPDWSIMDARSPSVALAMSSVLGPFGVCDGSATDQPVEITWDALLGVHVKLGNTKSPWYLSLPAMPNGIGSAQGNSLLPMRLRAGLLQVDGLVAGSDLTMEWDGVKTPLARP